MLNNIIILLVVAVLAVYVIIRQFTQQRVTMINLLLLPLLSAYASYNELLPAFGHFTPWPLIAGMAVGLLVGIATGIFRGRYTSVRQDSASGQVYSKPQLASSLMWLALLIVRIAAIVLSTSSLRDNLLTGTLIACGGTLFFFSISTQKAMVFRQFSRLQGGLMGQPLNLR
jgi:membrane protein CcdC involved in cytochrome C biogenesis